MNEADSPDQQTAPIEPAEMPPAIESLASDVLPATPSEDWQTVDFPGAISVDAIPRRVEEWHTAEQCQTKALNEAGPQGVIHYSNAEISPAVTYSAAILLETNDAMQLQQLQQENVALRDRLMQAEQALGQQLKGQLAAEGEGSTAFEPSQQHLQQLLQELERSHQATQRQQILVETLTEQLGSSQERIAQLERDCALTQQRHNEQVQQVLQAESNCRDLRLRLHRQQQQTLQFKAALEKCLEVPTAYGNPVMPDVALASTTQTPDVEALLPKNPPVQPWSLTAKASPDSGDPLKHPRSLFKLLNHGSSIQEDPAASIPELMQTYDVSDIEAAIPFSDHPANDEAVPNEPSALLGVDDPQFVTQLMQLMFPADAAVSAHLAADALQPELLLDFSSFTAADVEADVEADATDLPTLDVSSAVTFISPDRPLDWATAAPEPTAAENQPNSVSVSPDAIATDSPALLSDRPTTDPLGDHLATLIDPQLPAEHASPAAADVPYSHRAVDSAQASIALPDAPNLPPEKHPLPSLTTSTTAIPPIFAADVASPVAASSSNDSATTARAGWTWRDRLVSAGKMARATDVEAAQPAKQLALSATGRQAVPPPDSVSSPTALTPTSLAVPPSPIVYPQRSTKKLASLAAVDLPTFPKR